VDADPHGDLVLPELEGVPQVRESPSSLERIRVDPVIVLDDLPKGRFQIGQLHPVFKLVVTP